VSLPAVVSSAELGMLTEFARGGIGSVSTIATDLGAPSGRLVAKLFDQPEKIGWRALYRMVGWRRELLEAERRRLDRVTVWPLSVITRSDDAVGFVMQHVPSRFEDEVRLPSGLYRPVLREAQYLLGATARIQRLGLRDATPRARTEIVWSLAETLGFLHARGIVVGDLSARNVLWSTDPSAVLLVDCDSMVVDGVGSPHPVLETVDWEDPSKSERATRAADVYKFALFVLRALGRSFQSRDPAIADEALDPSGRGLLRMSLARDPEQRPDAGTWERWAVGRRAASGLAAR